MSDDEKKPTPPANPAETKARQAAKRTPAQAAYFAEVTERQRRLQEMTVPQSAIPITKRGGK
jgi:hypothetical protein